MPTSILDDCLPAFDFGHRHTITVAAPPARVYEAADTYRLSESRIIRALFRLRGLPAPWTFRKSLQAIDFVILGEQPGREVVFGLAAALFSRGRFMAPVEVHTPSGFRALSARWTIKIAANLCVDPLPDGGARLSTETRVHCTDRASRALFGAYWTLIRGAGGLIRRVMLAGIRDEAMRGTLPPAEGQRLRSEKTDIYNTRR